MALQEGNVCQSVALKWEQFYRAYEEVYKLASTTTKEKKDRVLALIQLELPQPLTVDYFGTW